MTEPENSYIGDFCMKAGVTKQQIDSKTPPSVAEHLYTNGFVLEVCGYTAKIWEPKELYQFLYDAAPDNRMSAVKIETLRKTVITLRNDKRSWTKGSKKYNTKMPQIFSLCRGILTRSNRQSQADVQPSATTVQHVATAQQLPPQSSSSTHIPVSTQVKESNSLHHEIAKKQKHLDQLKQKTIAEKQSLLDAVGETGHCTPRNVHKRDERAKNTRDELKNTRDELKELKASHEALKKENCELKEELTAARSKSQEDIMKLKSKVVAEQKLKSKAVISHRKELEERPNEIEMLKQKMVEQAEHIKYLENKLEKAKGELNAEGERVLHLRDSNGHYSLNSRMCVNNLSGLELAQEKVPLAMQHMARDLFNTIIPDDELPCRKTIQNINDEGHYIAKRYIADQLKTSEHWGILKDGTQRQRQKICDTSITLDTGAIICLGFKKVAKEDADTIAAITQEHLEELAAIDPENSEDYLEKILATLSFLMSDRAANEKKSNQLLENWRQHTLENCGSDKGKEKVHHMYCMAHVLLGFYKDVSAGLFAVQKQYVQEHGKLGRDKIEKYASWTQESIATRVARFASDVFGPIGDHLGVRDIWQAECARRGVKSKIGAYKDNRFNCLFETSAQVIHHREDFQPILHSLLQKNPSANYKIQSLNGDLDSDIAMTFVDAAAVTFLHVTGPFWVAMQEGDVAYLNLSTFIQPLLFFLKDCVENPDQLLHDPPDFLSAHSDPSWQVYTNVKNIKERCTPLLRTCLSTIARSLVNVIERQLVDFLPGGKYEKPASDHELNRTSSAPKTNLGPEHHFGWFDSSKKKRPNSTVHHHTTLQLLKRNGPAMRKWYDEMTESEQQQLWKDAKRNGNLLRAQHKMQEEKENKKITDQLHAPPPKRRKLTPNVTVQPVEQPPQHEELAKKMPAQTTIYLEKQWVAVAYQDNWYPGIIIEVQVSDSTEVQVRVDFMSRSRCKGASNKFKPPNGKDVQIVDPEFIIATDFTPASFANGRWFTIDNTADISDTYELYAELNFRD